MNENATETPVQVGHQDLRTLLICSVRYSMGRMTYMPSYVQDLVKVHVGVLSAQDLNQFASDVEECSDARLGMDFDAAGWRRFAEWCRKKATEAVR